MRTSKQLCILGLAALLGPGILPAQSNVAPDTAEPGSIEEIAKATTEPQFLSPWVSYLAGLLLRAFAARVPASHRRRAGRAGRFRDRVRLRARAGGRFAARRVFTIGHSEEGRDIVLARDRGREGHPVTGAAEARHRGARRSAHDRHGGGGADHRSARGRSITSTQRCTRTRPARPSRCWSSPIASRCPISR